MDWPWWFRLMWVVLLAFVVLRFGRWFLALYRGQRDGSVDPDALWPPGRTEGGRPRDDDDAPLWPPDEDDRPW